MNLLTILLVGLLAVNAVYFPRDTLPQKDKREQAKS